MMQAGLRCGPLQHKGDPSRYSSTYSSRSRASRLRAAQPKRCASARRVLVCSTDLQKKVTGATEEKTSDWSEDLVPAGASSGTAGRGTPEEASTSNNSERHHDKGHASAFGGSDRAGRPSRGKGRYYQSRPKRDPAVRTVPVRPVPGHDPEPAPDHNLKLDMTVVGRVIKSHDRGANIQLLDDPRIIGYMPIKDGPFIMKDSLEDPNHIIDQPMPVGVVREFTVRAIPDDMEYYGRGPLLIAKFRDATLLWRRAEQIAEVLDEERGVLKLTVNNANNGGLLSAIDGLPAFLPFSLVSKRVGTTYISLEETKTKYLGQPIYVSIRALSRADRKITLNMVEGTQRLAYRNLRVGALVWCFVRRVESYGVLLGIEDTRISGLLHISAISRAHVENPWDVFEENERVRCLITNVDQESQRVSLSTADLEETTGDMLLDKVEEMIGNMLLDKNKVYDAAESQLEAAMQRIERRREDDDLYGRNQPSNRNGSFDFNADFRG